MSKLIMLSLCAAFIGAASSAASAETYTVQEGCHYPNGWNVGDFSRDIGGIPNGEHHECIDTYQNGHRIARVKAPS